MSGSSPLPPKPQREAVFREQRPFQASRQDVYTGESLGHGRPHIATPSQYNQLPSMQTGAQPVHPQDRERLPPTYAQMEEPRGNARPYSPQSYHNNPDSRYPGPSTTSVASLGSAPFPVGGPRQNNRPGAEPTPHSSPKSQRKTKGHVASACVPCKRAHLRCDAQRPCSRCLSNGKEDACVDVQHKKRGRPRLRDDREPRFEATRFSHPDESLSRRSSLYSPATSTTASYDDALRRSQSYRTIKSQPSESDVPSYPGHERANGPQAYALNPTMSERTQEAVAFLTLDLTIANASEPFFEVLGTRDVLGRRLLEIVSRHEEERVVGLQSSLRTEQTQREPNYLPPIFMREESDRVLRSIAMGGESLSRFRLDRLETITFVAADGQMRPCLTRIGLAKEGSIYFVILRLEPPSQVSHPQPPPSASRDFSRVPQALARPSTHAFDMAREPSRGRPADASHGHQHQFGGPSPGLPSLNQGPIGSSQAARPYQAPTIGRVEHVTTPSIHIPRSELPAHGPRSHEYQLPPIRTAPQPSSRHAPAWQFQDQPGRVDIGRILDGPAPTRRD